MSKSCSKSAPQRVKPILPTLPVLQTSGKKATTTSSRLRLTTKKTLTYELGERKAKIKSGNDVAIGDVVASHDDGSEPIIAPMAGKAEVTDKSIIITPAGQSVVRYEIPGFKQLMVKDGDQVVAGQRLTNGSINLHELMRLQGVESTQRYIMNEILRIFAGQGQNIADKHLEIIVRQMFSRVQIEEAGDSRICNRRHCEQARCS